MTAAARPELVAVAFPLPIHRVHEVAASTRCLLRAEDDRIVGALGIAQPGSAAVLGPDSVSCTGA